MNRYAIHQEISEAMAEDAPLLASLAERLADEACEDEGIERTGPISHQVTRPNFPQRLPDGTEVWPRPRLLVDFPARSVPTTMVGE